jgi:hypothetical protein
MKVQITPIFFSILKFHACMAGWRCNMEHIIVFLDVSVLAILCNCFYPACKRNIKWYLAAVLDDQTNWMWRREVFWLIYKTNENVVLLIYSLWNVRISTVVFQEIIHKELILTEKIEEEFSVDTTPRSTFGFFWIFLMNY